MTPWLTRVAASAALLCAFAFSAQAQAAESFPSKPIRLLIPYGPGGLTDITARMISEPLREIFGQPVVVESKPGGSGIVAFQEMTRAKPDGHTLVIGVNTTNLLNPIVRAHEMPFDVRKILTPVTGLTEAPQVFLATKVDFPPNTVKEFMDHARANPGKFNHAVIGQGSNSHFDFLLMQRKYDFSIVTVPARSGAASAQVDLINGAIHVAMMNAATSTPLVKAGKLKALAVTGDKRTADRPDVPTLKEQGFTDFGIGTWSGLFAPAGTPKEVVDKIHAAVTKVLASDKVKEQMQKFSIVSFASESPEAFEKWLDAEFVRWTAHADQFRKELNMPPKGN